MTQQYKIGKWYGWNGGECPVHPDAEVTVKFSSGVEDDQEVADFWNWGFSATPIVAFKIDKLPEEKREPREVWAVYDKNGKYVTTKLTEGAANIYGGMYLSCGAKIVRMVEVIE